MGSPNVDLAKVYKYLDGQWQQIGSDIDFDGSTGASTAINDAGTILGSSATTNGTAVAYNLTNKPAFKVDKGAVNISGSLNVTNNINIDGNVGISTDSMTNSLHIQDDGTLKLENLYGKGIIQDGSEDNAIYFNYRYNYSTTNLLNLHASDSIRFYTASYIYNQAQSTTIDSNGYVVLALQSE